MCQYSQQYGIGIGFTKKQRRLHHRCFSGDFPQLSELRVLITPTGDCFSSVRLRSRLCRIFEKYLGKQMW